MLELIIGDTLPEPKQTCPIAKTHWFQSLIETFKKFGSEFFGAGDFEIRRQRMLDYTVKPSNKFVLAKYSDGFYRTACITGKSKKMQLFIVSFYHNKKCLYVKPTDIIFKHGNLLNSKVSFILHGKHLKGKVYGNNSPANKGFPSMFYIKKKDKWHKVPFKMIFLTKKQFNKFKVECQPPEKVKKMETDDLDTNKRTFDALNCEEHIKDLKQFDGDFEMS